MKSPKKNEDSDKEIEVEAVIIDKSSESHLSQEESYEIIEETKEEKVYQFFENLNQRKISLFYRVIFLILSFVSLAVGLFVSFFSFIFFLASILLFFRNAPAHRLFSPSLKTAGLCFVIALCFFIAALKG